MTTLDTNRIESWPRCPDAATFFLALFRAFAANNPPIEDMEERFLAGSGVTLLNLIDHWTLHPTFSLTEELTLIGLVERTTEEGDRFWEHPQARLPRVRIEENLPEVRMALAVEDLNLFAEANGLPLQGQHGDPDSGYEETRYPLPNGELALVVRQGYRGFQPGHLAAAEARMLNRARETFRSRIREGGAEEVTEAARRLVQSVIEEIGRDRATDAFFEAERDYYLTRNTAARWQYQQQLKMGFGWANHDHHTYRSSRQGFRSLLYLWQDLGFIPRERFYAGAEAGWGAQVLEHPVSRVVLFCDVDMAPEELDIDFTAVGLPPQSALGTIGLWCGLHGDSIGTAGLHHLEAEYEFARAQANMEAAGFGVMAPFTDLPMLKQAFTVAEVWQVAPERVEALRASGLITAEQAERFLTHGAAGSHLEILQRWEGFKGFNKTGVSAIIRETDARRGN